MLTRRQTLAALGAAAAAPAFAATGAPYGLIAEGGFDRAAFDLWVSIRAGGGRPVWWVSEGTLRESPSGRLIAFMEGFDTAVAHWPDRTKPLAHQYNRKIYWFRDPATGAVVGDRIAYPYQFISYELVGDRVETFVEQGAGARLQRIGPGRTMAHRRVGRSHVFTAPLFLDLELPGGRRMQAFENYDFVVNPERPPADWALAWVRTGQTPPSLGTGQAVMHLVTRRHESFAELPAAMRAHVEATAPLWTAPPADLAEVRRLQRG